MRSTGRKEIPRTRRSRYDFLLDAVDQDVKLLVRGEDFDAPLATGSLRRTLYSWAQSRGVVIETDECWRDPDTGEPGKFGADVPFGLYVKVSSK
jgi:hypothetical protein